MKKAKSENYGKPEKKPSKVPVKPGAFKKGGAQRTGGNRPARGKPVKA